MNYVALVTLLVNAIVFFFLIRTINNLNEARKHYENAEASYKQAKLYVEETEKLQRERSPF